MSVINEELVLTVMRRCYWLHFAGCKTYKTKKLKDFETRNYDIFYSLGYKSKENTTAFFCVHGSPNKVVGYVRYVNDLYVLYHCNGKNYKCDLTTIQ